MAFTALLTAAEVADRLGVSARTVARMAEDGRLSAAQKLPGATGALLFDPVTVDALIGQEPTP